MNEQQTKQTDTERLYNDLADGQKDKTEEVEQTEQETAEEEIYSEEELEVEREIAHYQTKIEALDDKLAQYRADSIADKKRQEMRAVNYTDAQIERYLSHVEGETDAEIKASILELTTEIPPRDNYGDPSAMNGAKQKPTHADPAKSAGRHSSV
ncbi:hypothetical protein [Paracerasibacillus soli]|uniref:Uncharacterized protein n=1 Tax=Paracerasibacillus soli TaxID=480284 RepID=A0ABU5CUI0_9BACI|nr:hypothetical protein [Virgibacillus soli]MDY0409966.1 hypothetical protein [Virgibacillus soli]